MLTVESIERTRESLFRCSEAEQVDSALRECKAIARMADEQKVSLPTPVLLAALRTSLVGWRYSYYRGTDEAFHMLDEFVILSRSLLGTLSQTVCADDARVAFACTDARILRNRGELDSGESVLAHLGGFTEGRSRRATAELHLELGNCHRYRGDYLGAVDEYLLAAQHVGSAHGRVALVHYFAAAGCELIIESQLNRQGPPAWLGAIDITLASLRLLSSPASRANARRFPLQYAYIRKHEAVIEALSGSSALAWVAWNDARQIMDSLGTGKGQALIAYSEAVIAVLVGDDARAARAVTQTVRLSGTYYPPGARKADDLLRVSRQPQNESDLVPALQRVAWLTPKFVELLTRAHLDTETDGWLRVLARDLGGAERGEILYRSVLEAETFERDFWSACTRSDLRARLFRTLVDEYEDRFVTAGIAPNADAGADEWRSEFVKEIAAYKRAGIGAHVVAEHLGMAIDDVNVLFDRASERQDV